jgi:nucleoside-diphosphate-sugar epimerase
LKKIIILGSSGFIGKSLNDYLNKKKYKVINISRSKGKNILKLKKLPTTDYIIYCINNKNIQKSLSIFKHFKFLLKHQAKKVKILFFSSGAVYGPRSLEKKFKENDYINIKKYKKFFGYKKKYAKEKYLLEEEFKKIAKDGYKVSIARGFTFYGKHILNYDYLISKLILAVKSRKIFKIKNSNTIRSYMHADDMCRWLIKILSISSTECPVVNLGSDKIIDLKKLAYLLNKSFKAKIQITKNASKKIDYYIPSIKFAHKYLKLRNTVNFNNAISLLIK